MFLTANVSSWEVSSMYSRRQTERVDPKLITAQRLDPFLQMLQAKQFFMSLLPFERVRPL